MEVTGTCLRNGLEADANNQHHLVPAAASTDRDPWPVWPHRQAASRGDWSQASLKLFDVLTYKLRRPLKTLCSVERFLFSETEVQTKLRHFVTLICLTDSALVQNRYMVSE